MLVSYTLAWMSFLFLSFFLLTPAGADYRVQPGDVVEIIVTGTPDLQRRVSVSLDGTISFPFLGTIHVARMSQSELQSKVQNIIATKFLQKKMNIGNGREIDVDPEQVSVSVVEYRPVYVDGDVAKPGGYGYRPLMTARQAIAMSGGYDFIRTRSADQVIEIADLKSNYKALWIELAQQQARVWRIKSDQGETDGAEGREALLKAPIEQTTSDEIVRIEADRLAASRSEYQHERAFLEGAIDQSDRQIKLLTEQGLKETEGAQADIEDLQRLSELFAKGAVAAPRVSDARRAVLLSSTRKLQTDVQIMQLKRQQSELARQNEKLADDHKDALLRELQEASGKVGSLRARLQGIEEKLIHTGLRSGAGSETESIPPQIIIIREEQGVTKNLVGNEDFVLQPSDVVQVHLNAGVSRLAQTSQLAHREK